MPVVDRVEAGEGREQPDVCLGDRVADEVALVQQARFEAVQRREQPVARRVVGGLRAREAAAVHPVVDLGVDPPVDLVDLGAQVVRVEVGGALAVVVTPLGRQVEGQLREVVGHDDSPGDVDDRRDGDASRVPREALVVRVLDPRDAQHRVDPTGVEVEGPGVGVMGRAADPHGDGVLQPEESSHDGGAVGPGAGP